MKLLTAKAVRWSPGVGKRLGWAVALLLAALAGPQPGAAASTPAPQRVWPAPPDEPRIAYVRSLTSPADFGVQRSTLGRFKDWLVGSKADGQFFVKPFGLALDAQGDFCLSDTGANAVCYFDAARKKWHRWDTVGKTRFASPVAVAKQDHTLYVADSALGCIIAFTDEGKPLFQITAGLKRPSGLAISGQKLYVTDSQAQAVLMFDLEGHALGQFGGRGSGAGEFNFPSHISADASGSLLVTDSMNSRIQIFDASGKFLRQLGSRGDGPGYFTRPKGAAVDSYGHLYVLDALFDNFQIFDPQGRLLMALGQTGKEPGEFWLPNAIAISRDNQIYVADSYNHRVQVFRFIGQP
jgi:sugar lactone lactonase YvrE